MRTSLRQTFRGGWFCLLAIMAVGMQPGTVAQIAPAPAHPSPVGHDAYIQRHCASCHNDKIKTAGLSLQGLDIASVPARAEMWEKVLRKVQSGEMPPTTVRVRPDAVATAALTSYLESSLDRAATLQPNPGRPVIHRLNRAEYSNAIRDLLALDIQPGAWLPVDDSGYGFDNIGAVLSTSPVLLERYMSAARRVSRLAVGDLTLKPVEDVYEAKRDPFKGTRNERLSDDLPFDSRAGISVQHYFPVDAEYVFKIRIPRLPGAEEDATEPDPYQVRVPVKAGLHTVGATSPRENAKAESEGPGARGGGAGAGRGQIPYPVDLRLNGARVKRFDVPGGTPDIRQLIIGGPYNPTGRGTTASRTKIFICSPKSARDEPGCAKDILEALARRAFRRPVTAADVQPLFEIYERARTHLRQGSGGQAGRAEAAEARLAEARSAKADFEAGIQRALEALLVSPNFLFRIEQDPPSPRLRRASKEVSAYRISDIELASRLSFFLWSSIPDDQLLELAERGRLKNATVLEQQVQRMLLDPRSDSLVSNFAGQWLHLRNVETVTPDPVIFPFDEALRAAFMKETELFVASILREDRSVLDLLTADHTFVNERLADHYGIPKIYGSQFRRVTLTDPNRKGLLGKGSILTVTSYPNRTSVVQRGLWILENLLGTPPPPPPADVPELVAKKDGKALTMREQMEQHRANPVCAACHSRMDPIGFALENYDGVGKWRDKDAGATIDASGRLPDGTEFSGPAGLTELMTGKYREDFVRTVTEKLMTYALGRGVEYYDLPTVRAISREAAKDNYRLSSIILAIVKSTPFQMRSPAS